MILISKKIFLPHRAGKRRNRENGPRRVIGLFKINGGMHTQSYDIYIEFAMASYNFRKVDYQKQKDN